MRTPDIKRMWRTRGRTPVVAELPDEVYVALVASLFGMLQSLYMSVGGVIVVALKTYLASPSPLLLAITLFLTLTGAARIATNHQFGKIEAASRTKAVAMLWERRFAIWAWGFTAGTGALLFVTFVSVDYLPDHLLVEAVAYGIAVGITARNAARPRIAISQLALLVGPMILASICRLDISYSLLAGLNILFLIATSEIVRVNYAMIIRLKMTSREKTTLAASLASKHELLEAALSNMSHGLCLLDADHRIVMSNARFQDLLQLPGGLVAVGVPFRDIIGHRLAATKPEDHLGDRGGAVDDWSYDLPTSSVMTLSDGRSLAMSRQPTADGGTVVLFDDVTERNRSEARIAHLASHDALTDVPNRTTFNARLKNDIDHLGADASLSLLCLDLDRFKAVNDMLGHAAGDALLCEVTQRMNAVLEQGMMLARIGGDEFVVVANGLDEPETIELAQRIIAVVSVPYELGAGPANIGVSVGAVRTNDPLTRPHDLLQAADLALYNAKNGGRGTVHLYAPGMQDTAGSRRRAEIDLRLALQRGEFIIHYQPQFDVATRRVVGVEALVRWMHPKRGLIPPNDFIPLAEETGLIVSLGEWVLRKACQDAASWPEPVRVAINISSAQFGTSDFLALVKSALGAAGLGPDRLDLEITESQILLGNENTLTTLRELRAMGIRLSTDDFGTGHSSLTSLRTFSFDSIKIDRSFICNLTDDPLSLPIVRSIVSLSRDIGVPTIAEGVETDEQLDLVRTLGCQEVQGYLLALPMPSAAINSLLSTEADRRSSAA